MIGGGAAGLELETAAALADGHTGCTFRHFWSWLVLGVKPVLFRLHDDNPPGDGDGGQRLALPGQGLRLPGAFIRVKKGTLR